MEQQIASITRTFHQNRPLFTALGDTTRQDILLCLADTHQMTVQQLADHLQIARPTVSHHLKVLKQAGLLGEVKAGTRTYYQPTLTQAITSVKLIITGLEELAAGAECTDKPIKETT